MGLDMYLEKRVYVKRWRHQEPEEQCRVTVLKGGKPHPDVAADKVSYVIEETCYWRKANAIHQWFVDNCQEGIDNCQTSYVPDERLEELRDILKELLNDRTQEKAEELLPVSKGFFFGTYEYDEYYWGEVERTYEVLNSLNLSESPLNVSYYYHSSW